MAARPISALRWLILIIAIAYFSAGPIFVVQAHETDIPHAEDDSVSLTTDSIRVEQVKQLFEKGLDWLAHAIVWIFKWFSGVIVVIIDIIAKIMVFTAKAGIKFVATILSLIQE